MNGVCRATCAHHALWLHLGSAAVANLTSGSRQVVRYDIVTILALTDIKDKENLLW